MSREWTIDTNILDQAASVDPNAFELLNRVSRTRQKVAFDSGNVIQDQYRRCFKRCKRQHLAGIGFVESWFKSVVSGLAVSYSGNLTRSEKNELQRRNCSHRDHVFIGVCKRTVDKLLVTQDRSDFNDSVCSYLSDAMSIEVLTKSQALNRMDTSNTE